MFFVFFVVFIFKICSFSFYEQFSISKGLIRLMHTIIYKVKNWWCSVNAGSWCSALEEPKVNITSKDYFTHVKFTWRDKFKRQTLVLTEPKSTAHVFLGVYS